MFKNLNINTYQRESLTKRKVFLETLRKKAVFMLSPKLLIIQKTRTSFYTHTVLYVLCLSRFLRSSRISSHCSIPAPDAVVLGVGGGWNGPDTAAHVTCLAALRLPTTSQHPDKNVPTLGSSMY